MQYEDICHGSWVDYARRVIGLSTCVAIRRWAKLVEKSRSVEATTNRGGDDEPMEDDMWGEMTRWAVQTGLPQSTIHITMLHIGDEGKACEVNVNVLQ